jgi:transcriptional regulator with XRE-family HTH domain
LKRAPDPIAARRELYLALARGALDLREASRKLRRIIGLSQSDYANRIGISPRVLIDFERGVGNPTLKTLERIGKPFGLEVVFLHRPTARDAAGDTPSPLERDADPES